MGGKYADLFEFAEQTFFVGCRGHIEMSRLKLVKQGASSTDLLWDWVKCLVQVTVSTSFSREEDTNMIAF